jgi:hypothetical protein
MWQFTTLDLFMGAVIFFTLGFGFGVAWWEWIKPVEKVYAGSSGDVVDLSVHSGSGGLPSDMGSGTARNTNPSTGDENHLDNRGTGGNPSDSPPSTRFRV